MALYQSESECECEWGWDLVSTLILEFTLSGSI